VSNLIKFFLNLPQVIIKEKILVKPKQILETRIFKKKNIFTKYLVKWKGYFLEDAIWEKKENSLRIFPSLKVLRTIPNS